MPFTKVSAGSAIVAMVSLLSTGSVTAQQVASSDFELVDAVVASVDGVPITLVDLEDFSERQGRLLPAEDRRSRADVLEAMVRLKMFEAEFARYGIAATDADVDDYVDHLITESGTSREAVEETLANMGLGWEDYFERMRQEVQRLALINREIRARVNVTPEEVERYWRERPEYLKPERIELADIFIPFPPKATPEAVAQVRARAGEAYEAARRNFAKAAAKYSEGPDAEGGGVLGTFRRGSMALPFEQAVSGLSTGQVSRPFEAAGGMHLLKLVRVVPPERVPFEEVRAQIEEQLYSETLEARFRRWVEEDLRKRHHVTKQLEELDALLAEGRS